FRPVYTLLSFFTIGYSADSILYSYSIAVFYFLLYVFFVFSIYKLTKEIFLPDTSGSINKILLICFANIQVACIYFFTTEKIEIFGWLSSPIIHLVPVVFILFSAW